jgi:hypothetical protein
LAQDSDQWQIFISTKISLRFTLNAENLLTREAIFIPSKITLFRGLKADLALCHLSQKSDGINLTEDLIVSAVDLVDVHCLKFLAWQIGFVPYCGVDISSTTASVLLCWYILNPSYPRRAATLPNALVSEIISDTFLTLA